jgi:diguanylate cyclase (GGDEF)-like protein
VESATGASSSNAPAACSRAPYGTSPTGRHHGRCRPFQRINDQYGHHVGDEVIRAVSPRLSEVVWHDDAVRRYDGEEFAAVLRSDLTGALDCAERIRGGMATRPVQTSAGPVSVTVSVGVAVLDPGDADLETVLNRADQALYGAKRDGRNRVAWAAGDVADVPAE